MIYAVRWLWYLYRLSVYRIISFLRFISRKNVRSLIVLAIIAAVFLAREPLYVQLGDAMRRVITGYQPEDPVLVVALLIFGFAAIFAYAVASALLIFLLSLFRLGLKPIRPHRKLRATKTKISNAVVRIVVPSLPKRMKG